MLLDSAEALLEKLACGGGVVVCTNALTEFGIAEARACGRMYVNAEGLGFVVLHGAVAHPNFSQPEGCIC